MSITRTSRGTPAIGAIMVSLMAITTSLAPSSHADMMQGNYQLHIPDRYDFHTWIWAIKKPTDACPPGCVHVASIPQPAAKAVTYQGDAILTDGRYTLTVDDPFGLRCGDIYYGPAIPTHDVYTWDATTLDGTLQSSFDTNCGGAPGGTNTYPINLTRL